MMKKYLRPEMEVIDMETVSVIAASDGSTGGNISSRHATFEEDAAETSQNNDVWQWMDK